MGVLIRLIVILIASCVSILPSFCGDIVFVVDKSVDIESLTERDIRNIFLREIRFINGHTIVPVNLPPNNPLRIYVEKKLLHMDREELQLFWNRKYMNGIDPPKVLSSEKSVKMFVRKVKGAIGYIEEEELEEGLKVIFRVRK